MYNSEKTEDNPSKWEVGNTMAQHKRSYPSPSVKTKRWLPMDQSWIEEDDETTKPKL